MSKITKVSRIHENRNSKTSHITFSYFIGLIYSLWLGFYMFYCFFLIGFSFFNNKKLVGIASKKKGKVVYYFIGKPFNITSLSKYFNDPLKTLLDILSMEKFFIRFLCDNKKRKLKEKEWENMTGNQGEVAEQKASEKLYWISIFFFIELSFYFLWFSSWKVGQDFIYLVQTSMFQIRRFIERKLFKKNSDDSHKKL